MRNIITIVERELRSYFSSPIAYVVLTAFTLLAGILFNAYLNSAQTNAMRHQMQSAQFGQPAPPLDVPGMISRGFLQSLSDILLFIAPMITMALFSEEKKRGTIELLLTSPITDLQVVLGKFFSAASFFVVLLLTTWIPMAVLFIYGSPAIGPIVTAYFGLLLYILVIVAFGMFISTLTENQVVAAVITFVAVLFLYLMPWLASRIETAAIKEAVAYLSVISHLEDFFKGVLVSSHVIFYLSMTVLGLFLTYRSLDSLRWRG